MRRLALLALVLLSTGAPGGCATPSGDAYAVVEGPVVDDTHPGYWLWHDGNRWHLRTTTGPRSVKPHRFQGAVTAVGGVLTALRLSDATLADRAALGEDGVLQFDVELTTGTELDVKSSVPCVRFDLFVDGKRRADRVHLGTDARSPSKVPFERCGTR